MVSYRFFDLIENVKIFTGTILEIVNMRRARGISNVPSEHSVQTLDRYMLNQGLDCYFPSLAKLTESLFANKYRYVSLVNSQK